jgi:hypothetical protein
MLSPNRRVQELPMWDCDAVFVIVLSLKRWSDYLRTLVFCRVIAGEKHERKSKISFPPFCGQMMQHRTRIKICGLTNLADVNTVVASGADALGFVFYPPSPRYVEPDVAATLLQALPPFVVSVGLFVNVTEQDLQATVKKCRCSCCNFMAMKRRSSALRWRPVCSGRLSKLFASDLTRAQMIC